MALFFCFFPPCLSFFKQCISNRSSFVSVFICLFVFSFFLFSSFFFPSLSLESLEQSRFVVVYLKLKKKKQAISIDRKRDICMYMVFVIY